MYSTCSSRTDKRTINTSHTAEAGEEAAAVEDEAEAGEEAAAEAEADADAQLIGLAVNRSKVEGTECREQAAGSGQQAVRSRECGAVCPPRRTAVRSIVVTLCNFAFGGSHQFHFN